MIFNLLTRMLSLFLICRKNAEPGIDGLLRIPVNEEILICKNRPVDGAG